MGANKNILPKNYEKRERTLKAKEGRGGVGGRCTGQQTVSCSGFGGLFPVGKEVFGFYWFHMTRQSLFKML